MIVYFPHMCTLSFMCTYSVVHTPINSKIMPACGGTILTNSQMSRVCTLALLWPPYLFVFVLKVHHPPLESNESHAGGAALKVCQRGEAPGPGLESPIATQSARPSPVQCNSRAGQAPIPHCPSTHCFKTPQTLFHWETCVVTVQWTGRPATDF